MARPRIEPTIILGPVLYFRGEQSERWRLSVLFVLEGEAEPEDLRVDGVGLAVPPRHVGCWRTRHVWRFDFAVPRGADESTITYGFEEGTRWRVTVPGLGARVRIAYTSCNGVEDEATMAAHPAPRNALWGDVFDRHAQYPFHLLLQGGDQLYADAVWQCPLLARWRTRPAPARYEEPMEPAMAEEAMAFYFNHYLKTWSQPEVAAVLSQVPSVMMWDDHDIFDGYGSHTEPMNRAPVLRGVAEAARWAFTMFQIGSAADRLPECVWGGPRGTFSQGFRVGAFGILAPDMRSERTPRRVFSDTTWHDLPLWLSRFEGCRHLLLLSSVPLLYADTGGIERFLGRLPFRTGYEDDLRDQWRSHAHRSEWRRMLKMLVNFSRAYGCRVTVLSGEVHAGGRAVLRAGGTEIWQLISSGIVHPPPPRLYTAALERLAARTDQPMDGYTLEMPAFEESGRRIIRQRNWLALTVTDRGRVIARWRAEGEPAIYEQAI